MTTTSTLNLTGHRRLSKIELPQLDSYTRDELNAAAAWPAVTRYLNLVEKSSTLSDLSPTQKLKIRRHEAWLRSSLALFHHRATDEEICFFWSESAERHIQEAFRLSGLDQTGVAIFALGKLGAQELNFSSDVDLLLLRPDDRPAPLKEAREFIRILGEVDEWGFCHRVDLALRPGGSAASLIPTYSEFENHYGYHGEAWERLAFVRFRHIVGGSDSKSGVSGFVEQALRFARGFSYRRHLDYSVFEELRLLIHRIRRENPSEKPGEFHLKLHPGGIRDIELFAHALQTIHGGRRRDLQTHRTSVAFQKLREAELVSGSEAETLIDTYWYYRNLENRLQAENDEQTYRLKDPDLVSNVRARAIRIIEISDAGFPDVPTADVPDAITLATRGFNEVLARQALEEIQQTRVLSKKSERDEREKNLFLANFLSSLEKSGGDLDLGLGLLVDFIRTTRAKATLFSLLNREPKLVRQLAVLFGVSPWAGNVLCSRPELLDAFILRQEATELSTLDTANALDALSERRLLGELIATLHFLEAKDLDSCVANLTSLADSIATDLMLLMAKELGCDPVGIVALGKWGGGEMGLRSDLDFVFLTTAPATNDQQRLAKRFLNRITEAHRGGAIYSVDLRLRPSGHAGPILVQVEQLAEHLRTTAEIWERQSWLRARSVASLPHRLPAEVRDIILDRGVSATEEKQLAEIAKQLFKPIPTFDEPFNAAAATKKSSIDLKLTNGGLAPIEFAAQIGALQAGPSTSQLDRKLLETSTHSMIQFLEGLRVTPLANWQTYGPNLRDTHQWLRTIEQWVRVTGDVAGSHLNLGSSEFRRFVKTSGESSELFPKQLIQKLKTSATQLQTLLGR